MSIPQKTSLFRTLIYVCIASLLLSSCAKPPQKSILGKWEFTDMFGTTRWEFLENGTILDTETKGTGKGTYRLLDAKRLQITWGEGMAYKDGVCEITAITEDKLILTRGDNTTVWKRVR